MKNRACFGNISLVFFLMVFLLAGCSTTPAVRYYTLNPSFEMQRDIPQAVSGDTLAIGVGPVEFPKLLDRPQIVTRKSQNRVEVSEFHRWAGSFSVDFLRVLSRNISVLLSADRVAAYPWTDQFSPTYRIQLTVEQFEGRFGGDVVLNVTWSVWNKKDTNKPVIKHTSIKEPLSTEDYDALVAAQSRAIGTLSRAIVDEIERVRHR
ncbi:MAG: PqiC family protein [Thermodesulfobacteriota bacterium]|nr:PqiC family protein [Thermodesulfobacteriota bacterium]